MTLKAKYTGATDAQARWGQGEDPRPVLEEGKTYTVTQREVHSWHTCLHLAEVPGKKFNSVCFEEYDD